MDTCKIVFVQAGPGWGKTTAVRTLLEPCQPRMISLARQSLPGYISKHSTVVLDDLQALPVSSEEKLAELVSRSPENQRFVLLSRAPFPAPLALFAAAGAVLTLGEETLALDAQAVARLAAGRRLALGAEEIRRIQEESRGNPMAVVSVLAALESGAPLGQRTVEDALNRVGAYLDRTCLARLGEDAAMLLTRLACFPDFDGELASLLWGEGDAEQTLELAGRVTGLIRRGKGGMWYFPPDQFVSPYLQKKARALLSPAALRDLFLTGGRWYLRRGDVESALGCFQQTGRREDLTEALTHLAARHPDAGTGSRLRPWFACLEPEEVHASAPLACAMSALHATSCHMEEAQRWHQVLLEKLEECSGRGEEFLRIQGLLSWLSLVLPRRGARDLEAAFSQAEALMAAHGGTMPELSATACLPSLLQGRWDLSCWAVRGPGYVEAAGRRAEAVLGRHGPGLRRLLMMEYQLETGEDISGELLSLDDLRREIQVHGTVETEFALAALVVRTLCAAGQPDRAEEELADFRAHAARTGSRQLLSNIGAMDCRLSLLRNGSGWEAWYAGDRPREHPFLAVESYRYLTLVRCYIRQEAYSCALLLLGELLSYARAYHRPLDRVESLLLAAICRYRMGGVDWPELLGQALALGRRYGYVAVFAREGGALLPLAERFDHRDVSPGYWKRILGAMVLAAGRYKGYLSPAFRAASPLTQTESLVLRLLCQGKSTYEICGLLAIKPPTIKTHLYHIYQKLGVKNRSQAVKAAESLHLA